MKTDFRILETYCGGHLTTDYTVKTEEEALEILKGIQERNEPFASVLIYKRTRKLFSWKSEKIVEWWNE